MKRKDDKYWKKMTWDWYAVPYPSREYYNVSKKPYSATDLKVCDDCNRVYSVDTNKGSSKNYRQYNYSNFIRRGLKPEQCKVCKGEPVTIEEM